MQLTQKERMLLEDQKSHEQTCVQKYQDFANQAQDPQLKQLFTDYSNQEQQHLNTINQILTGQLPSMTQQGGETPNYASSSEQKMAYNQDDANLCKDLLITEKYISNTYDTTIFECRDSNLRQTLNHIQKEEQQHGEGIFNYMASHGMYQVQ
jgi:spore coat protein CotF